MDGRRYMDLPTAVFFGVLFGLMGCLAPAVLFERALAGGAGVSLGMCLASILVSLVMLTVVLLVVYTAAGTGFLEFGCAMVVSFLLFWAVEAVRGWRSANGRG